MSPPLAGRLALITGAGGAIGTAVMRSLRAQGAHVVGADLLGRPLAQARPPWEGDPVALDVRAKAQVTALVAAIAEQARAPIDILVNVAGVVSFGSAQDLAEEE
jgi:NAD(P)-dependent dehydrogenase (short-subunit alcohol dehydrogenase family)